MASNCEYMDYKSNELRGFSKEGLVCLSVKALCLGLAEGRAAAGWSQRPAQGVPHTLPNSLSLDYKRLETDGQVMTPWSRD